MSIVASSTEVAFLRGFTVPSSQVGSLPLHPELVVAFRTEAPTPLARNHDIAPYINIGSLRIKQTPDNLFKSVDQIFVVAYNQLRAGAILDGFIGGKDFRPWSGLRSREQRVRILGLLRRSL